MPRYTFRAHAHIIVSKLAIYKIPLKVTKQVNASDLSLLPTDSVFMGKNVR